MKAYLNTFKEAFINVVEKLISKNFNISISNEINLDSEVLHHAYFCNRKLDDFVPRLEYSEKVVLRQCDCDLLYNIFDFLRLRNILKMKITINRLLFMVILVQEKLV
jgi:hypothetical protein